MRADRDDRREWLEADGLGGFASGTVSGIRTRRYHAFLLSAATPPTGRQVLVAGLEAEVSTGDSTRAISSQRYAPDVIHPDGITRLESFAIDPWPRWSFRLRDDLTIEQSLFVPRGLPVTVLRWRLAGAGSGADTRLTVRPLLAGRDYHSLHHENGSIRLNADRQTSQVRWTMYDGVPTVIAASNGTYAERPDWYRNFEYLEERERGLDAIEDLACPGFYEFNLAGDEGVLLLAAATPDVEALLASGSPSEVAQMLADKERGRRAAFPGRMERSADAYLVRRTGGSTLVAGYPWFTDWGRDTFIAVRGLCLATGRYDDARQILLAWADAVSEGMLPNRFPDAGEAPEFNAVDASLWYVIAAGELLDANPGTSAADRAAIQRAIEAILDGYTRGTRFGIRADTDGLLAAGVPGVQLTWMDARVGDRVITPRIGKPVEVQALWVNALWIAARFSRRWEAPFSNAFAAFETRFWNEPTGALFDVIDVDHVPGRTDASFRPNQILAVGGLPLALLQGERARRVVDAVEARLWTPLGLRSLAPGEPGYSGRYAGGVESRDGAYHQGTVWPWLMGPFVDAWVRTRGGTPEARAEARRRFFEPLRAQLDTAGLGHLPEVANGDAPHTPGGCPFQAWSLGEALRLERVVLSDATAGRDTSAPLRHPTAAESVS
jgi:predicted glycogen debranching enzyme